MAELELRQEVLIADFSYKIAYKKNGGPLIESVYQMNGTSLHGVEAQYSL